ncbi:MAG: NAD(P)H-dependent oxidoreductase [Clostridia bacterium]|nr:NAD(P)H-dependent oxidoreductase [Clostridia bacterium]
MDKKIVALIVFVVLIALGIGCFFVINNFNNSSTSRDKHNNIQNENSTDSSIANNNIQDQNETKTDETLNKKVAVVYFSVTGTTKTVAEYIKDEVNGDIFEIVPKQKYSSSDLNWNDNSSRATKEQNNENARPEIENNIDVSNYDVIFLGYPIWWGNVPKIILSFIDNTNLDGKTVIPFCTSGSSGISTSMSTLKSYNSNANWITGNRFSSSTSKNEVSNWVKSLNY